MLSCTCALVQKHIVQWCQENSILNLTSSTTWIKTQLNFNFKREQCFETQADNFGNFHEAIYNWKVLLKKQRFSEEFDANDDVEGALDHVDHIEHFENCVDDDVDDAVNDADEHIGNKVHYAVEHIEKYV